MRSASGVRAGTDVVPYLLYTSPLGDIVRRYNMGFRFYVDDTQLCLLIPLMVTIRLLWLLT